MHFDKKLITTLSNQLSNEYTKTSKNLNRYEPISTNVSTLYERITHNMKTLEDLSYRMAVFGTQKSGKSTTLCSIVGKSVLPVRDTGMTVLPTEIHDSPYCADPRLEIPTYESFSNALMQASQRHKSKPFDFAKSGVGKSFIDLILNPSPFPSRAQGEDAVCEILVLLNDLCRLCIIEDLEFNPLKDLEEWPKVFIGFRTIEGMEGLTRGPNGKLVLVDMPGSDEAYMLETVQRLMATEVQRSAALLLLINYTTSDNSAQNTLRQSLSIFSTTQVKQDVYVVVNKIDEASPKKLEALLRDLSEKIPKALPANLAAMKPSIHFISAKYAMASITMKSMLATMSLEEIVSSENFEEFAHVAWPMDELEDVKDKDERELNRTCESMMKKSRLTVFLKDVIFVAMEQAAARIVRKVICDLDAFLISFQNLLELDLAVCSESVDKKTMSRFDQRLVELSRVVSKELQSFTELLKTAFDAIRDYQAAAIDRRELRHGFQGACTNIRRVDNEAYEEGEDISNAAQKFLNKFYSQQIDRMSLELETQFTRAQSSIEKYAEQRLLPAVKQLVDEAASELNVRFDIPKIDFIVPPPIVMRPIVGEEKSKVKIELRWLFSFIPYPAFHTIQFRAVPIANLENMMCDQLVTHLNNTKKEYWGKLSSMVNSYNTEISTSIYEVLSAFEQLREHMKKDTEVDKQESKIKELQKVGVICDMCKEQINQLRVEFNLSPSDNIRIKFDELVFGEAIGRSTFFVYRGTWRSVAVAMKRVPMFPEFEKEWTAVEWLRRVRHPNLTTLYGVCTDAPPENGINYCYIVSSLAEIEFGGKLQTCSLQQLIHEVKYPFNMPTLLKIAIGIASGMDKLHTFKSGFIHRDLKSPNIVMTYGFAPKICDFGEASICAKTQLRTRSVGTKFWMAPEVEGGRYGAPADVYSYGWILWELVTQKYPWDGEEPDYSRDLSNLEIVFIPSLKIIDHYKNMLIQLIRNCLNPSPEKRPTFSAIIRDLATIKTHLFISHNKHLRESESKKPEETPIKMPDIIAVLDAHLSDEHDRFVTRAVIDRTQELRSKVKKNLKDKLLSSDETKSEEENIEHWFEKLSNPREDWNIIFDNWYSIDTSNTEDERQFRIAFVLNSNPDALNRIVARYLQGTPYNALHASLRIYNTAVDWRNNSLTYPRKAVLADPLILLSLGEITVKRIGPGQYESPAIDKLCEGMKEWNLTREYSIFSSNCAHFVNDMIARIQEVEPNVKFAQSSPHDRATEIFLKRVRNGIIEKTITQEMFDFKLKDLNKKPVSSLTFYSHADLDEWCNRTIKEINDQARNDREKVFVNRYPSLFDLLKSFDRAFQRDCERFTHEQNILNRELIELRRSNADPKLLKKKENLLARANEILSKSIQANICAFPLAYGVSAWPTPPSASVTSGTAISAESNQQSNQHS